jgi:pimeloyl-ACP methyl ester carboxylesterase
LHPSIVFGKSGKDSVMKKIALSVLVILGFTISGKAQDADHVYGVYKTGNNHFVTIAPFGTGMALFFSDSHVFGLKKDGNDLLIGKTLGNTDETIGKISFMTMDEKTTIRLKYNDGHELSGEKLKLVERKMKFKNGTQQLAGELILPEGKGPFPVVVQTHGSGEETREASRGLAYLFAANGISSLIFDKRGCGESSGKEWRASFKDYANDLLAGVESLESVPQIDPKKIGIYGHSQGGWVVPLACSLQPEKIAFSIISAGNAGSPVAQTLYAGDEEFRIRGNDEQAIKEIHDFRRIKYEVGILGKSVDEYKKTILPAAEKKPWFKLTGGGLPENIFWKENGYYDPATALQSLQCPVLVLYADYDISTDSKTQLPLMKKLVPPSNATFKLFENANHMMMKVTGKDFSVKQIPLITQLADGYIELLIGWTMKTVNL